jgi:hypothetical protein
MDIFSNPMVENALKAMSPEEVANYKKIGEEMYGNINFEDSTIINNIGAPSADAAVYIESGLNSGLHPADLDVNELYCMVDVHGEKWYEKWGYTREEVPEPGLDLNAKKELDKIIEKKIEMEKAKKRL